MNFVNCSAKLSIFLCLLIVLSNFCNAYHYAVLSAKSDIESNNFCIYLQESYPSIPKKKSQADSHVLQNSNDVDWCTNSLNNDSTGQVLLLPAGNCSLSTQVHNYHHMGGKVVIFINRGSLDNMGFGESKSLNGTGIPMVKISESSAKTLKEMTGPVTVQLFRPDFLGVGYFFGVMWILAMFTIIVGSYRSGCISYDIFSKGLFRNSAVSRMHLGLHIVVQNHGPSIIFTPCYVAYFFVAAIIALVAAYFLKDFMFMFFFVFFVISSVISLFYCLEDLLKKFKVHFITFSFFYRNRPKRVSSFSVILLLISITTSVLWAIFRNLEYAWILQNVLNMAICVYLLKLLRLTSFKLCTALLGLLFIFDVFFVFVTPYFTKSGRSIMEEAATVGKDAELEKRSFTEDVAAGRKHFDMMPSLLQVMDIGFTDMSACAKQLLMLGLGDIFIPGLLLSYCYAFDLMTNKKNLYYFTSIITFGLGLFASSLALIYYRSGQPALLYLVPAVLIPPIVLSWCRGELNLFWSGFKQIRKDTQEGENNTLQQNANVLLTSTTPTQSQQPPNRNAEAL